MQGLRTGRKGREYVTSVLQMAQARRIRELDSMSEIRAIL